MAKVLEEKLREAACMGDEDTLVTILGQNVNINSQNSVNGWSALHWACKRGHSNIVRILTDHGADKNIKNFKGETPSDICTVSNSDQMGAPTDELKYVPSYLRNPPLNGNVDLGTAKLRPKHPDFSHMQTTSLPATHNDDVILKVRVHGSSDPDFIEIEIPRWKLTFNNLLKLCCEELEIHDMQVERIRKLPDTRLRNDNDVKRLRDFQALEIVLKTPVIGDKPTNCYQSISTCKNQTILY